jgi:hypothetical protein
MADEATTQPILTPGPRSINRGPWAALVDDDGSNTIGTPWNKQAIKDVILDPVDAALAPVAQAGSLVHVGGGVTPGTGVAAQIDYVVLPALRLGALVRMSFRLYVNGTPTYLALDAPGTGTILDLLALVGATGWPTWLSADVTFATIDGGQWMALTLATKGPTVYAGQTYVAGPYWTGPGIVLALNVGLPVAVNLQWRWSVEVVP